MSMAYVRKTYSVPAKRGTRVEYAGGREKRLGTILGTDGARLRIRLDGETNSGRYHPTWMLTYLKSEKT